jgi:hypothetical protein
MLDVLHDDRVFWFVDPVQHAPLGTEPGTMESGQGQSQWCMPSRRKLAVGLPTGLIQDRTRRRKLRRPIARNAAPKATMTG